MKTRTEITMSAFFALPEVMAQQAIEKANPYGSPKHRAAHDEILRIASSYLAAGRNELICCETFFGDY